MGKGCSGDESLGSGGPSLGTGGLWRGSHMNRAAPGAPHHSIRLGPGLLPPPPRDALAAEASHLFVPAEGRGRASGVRQSMRSRLRWDMPK